MPTPGPHGAGAVGIWVGIWVFFQIISKKCPFPYAGLSKLHTCRFFKVSGFAEGRMPWDIPWDIPWVILAYPMGYPGIYHGVFHGIHLYSIGFPMECPMWLPVGCPMGYPRASVEYPRASQGVPWDNPQNVPWGIRWHSASLSKF